MRIAVIGGGINGIMSAWALAASGATVTLFERGELMSETSSASSRMLHGGIRYLENFQFRFVLEALRERAWWSTRAPELSRAVRFHIPVRTTDRRPTWMLRLGVRIYDWMAGRNSFGDSRWLGADQLLAQFPDLRAEELRGAASYVDVVMDDRLLGHWAARQARAVGVEIREHCEVERLDESATVHVLSERLSFDCVVNAAGPWVGGLAEKSQLALTVPVTLVKGSHLILQRKFVGGLLLQSEADGRVIFVIPDGERSIVGTTERRVATADNPGISDSEVGYLLAVLSSYLKLDHDRLREQIVDAYSGVRVVAQAGERATSAMSRDHKLTWTGKVLHVVGGKWTTSRKLGMDVADEVLGKSHPRHSESIIWSNA